VVSRLNSAAIIAGLLSKVTREPFTSILSPSLNDIDFSLSNNCPMKISYDLGENSFLQFYIAPKIND
jgi:hypothetical protein